MPASDARRRSRRRRIASIIRAVRNPLRAKPGTSRKKTPECRRVRSSGRAHGALTGAPVPRGTAPPPQTSPHPTTYLLFVVWLGDPALGDDFAGIHLVVGEISELVDPGEPALKHTQTENTIRSGKHWAGW